MEEDDEDDNNNKLVSQEFELYGEFFGPTLIGGQAPRRHQRRSVGVASRGRSIREVWALDER